MDARRRELVRELRARWRQDEESEHERSQRILTQRDLRGSVLEDYAAQNPDEEARGALKILPDLCPDLSGIATWRALTHRAHSFREHVEAYLIARHLGTSENVLFEMMMAEFTRAGDERTIAETMKPGASLDISLLDADARQKFVRYPGVDRLIFRRPAILDVLEPRHPEEAGCPVPLPRVVERQDPLPLPVEGDESDERLACMYRIYDREALNDMIEGWYPIRAHIRRRATAFLRDTGARLRILVSGQYTTTVGFGEWPGVAVFASSTLPDTPDIAYMYKNSLHREIDSIESWGDRNFRADGPEYVYVTARFGDPNAADVKYRMARPHNIWNTDAVQEWISADATPDKKFQLSELSKRELAGSMKLRGDGHPRVHFCSIDSTEPFVDPRYVFSVLQPFREAGVFADGSSSASAPGGLEDRDDAVPSWFALMEYSSTAVMTRAEIREHSRYMATWVNIRRCAFDIMDLQEDPARRSRVRLALVCRNGVPYDDAIAELKDHPSLTANLPRTLTTVFNAMRVLNRKARKDEMDSKLARDFVADPNSLIKLMETGFVPFQDAEPAWQDMYDVYNAGGPPMFERRVVDGIGPQVFKTADFKWLTLSRGRTIPAESWPALRSFMFKECREIRRKIA